MDIQLNRRPAAVLGARNRLEILAKTELLFAPVESGIQRLTKLAQRLVDVPVCLVSLVTDECQFFAGAEGLPEPWASDRQTPLSHSFCQHVVIRDDELVVSDARQHDLVRDNLAIPDLGVIAYAGIPIRVGGEVVGSFCAIDTKPRDWSEDELELMRELCESVNSELEVRLLLHEREDALRRAHAERERSQQLLEAAPAPIVAMTSHDLRVTFANQEWMDLTGFAEPVGRTLYELFPELQGQGYFELFEEVARTAEPYIGREQQAIVANGPFAGQARFYNIAVLRVDAADAPHELLVHAVDVTPHVEARLSAERERQRLAMFADIGKVMASSLDYHDNLQRIVRLVVPELADWCIIDVLDEGDGGLKTVAVAAAHDEKQQLLEEMRRRYPVRRDSRQPAADAMRDAAPVLVPDVAMSEIEDRAADARHVELLTRLAPESVSAVPLIVRGEPVGAITYAYAESGRRFRSADDLTHQLELARRLAGSIETSRLYREVGRRAEAARVIERLAEGVVLVDDEGCVRLWNPAAYSITGVRAEDAVGRPVSQVIHGWSSEIEDRMPDTPLAPAPALTLSIDVSGAERWISVTGVRWEDGGAYAFRDVTSERDLERTRQELVATMSHELRTPLAAIYAAAVTLQRKELELEEAVRDTLLDTVQQQAERLTDLSNDILLASRLGARTEPVAEDPVSLDSILETVVGSARLSHGDRVLHLQASKELPLAQGDDHRLQQVLLNLVDNAAKYSPADGGIWLSAHVIEDGWLEVSVDDEGPGIPEWERDRVFEKFYRLDPDMRGGVGGTGLGLYICRELVERMGGEIAAGASSRGGARMSLRLRPHGSAAHPTAP